MKKIGLTLLIGTIIITNTYAKENDFYIGAALNKIDMTTKINENKEKTNHLLLLGGYDIYKYLTIEGRYTLKSNFTQSKNRTKEISSGENTSIWSVFLKPKYNIYKDINIYGLVGYGGTKINKENYGKDYANGLQWGIGTEYVFESDIGIFVDYTELYNDSGFNSSLKETDIKIKNFNLGVKYFF